MTWDQMIQTAPTAIMAPIHDGPLPGSSTCTHADGGCGDGAAAAAQYVMRILEEFSNLTAD